MYSHITPIIHQTGCAFQYFVQLLFIFMYLLEIYHEMDVNVDYLSLSNLSDLDDVEDAPSTPEVERYCLLIKQQWYCLNQQWRQLGTSTTKENLNDFFKPAKNKHISIPVMELEHLLWTKRCGLISCVLCVPGILFCGVSIWLCVLI